MNKAKKVLALSLLPLSLGLLSCGNKDNKSSGGKTADGRIKLTGVYVSHPLTKSVDEMKWLKEIEAQAGVSIQWEQVYSDWDTTKATRFASGDIPDILINATNNADYTTYKGLFQELTELIKSDAPNVQAMFKEEPDTEVLSKTLEGEIYSLPKFQGKWPYTNTVLFINQTWLDKLGLKMPTTFSELRSVLMAFKQSDCNGNGNIDDEIPMDFNGWFGGAYSLTALIGGMGIPITNWGWDAYYAENGTVKNYSVDPRYRDFIKFWKSLYEDGLLNENAITNDYSAFQSLSRGDENGNALVGCVFGWEETDKFGPNLYTQYKPVPPLRYDLDGKNYEVYWDNDYTGLNLDANRIAMSAKCKNKQAAMRFMDKFYDAEVSVQVLFGGISDGCVSKVGDNHYKIEAPLDPNTDAGTWKWTSTMADWGPMYIRRSTQIDMAQDMENAVNERKVYQSTLDKVKTNPSDGNYYPQAFMKYSTEETNTMAVDQANINNIIYNYWALWLTGQQDIDDDWSDYVSQVEKAGLSEVLSIRQKAFDKYRGK